MENGLARPDETVDMALGGGAFVGAHSSREARPPVVRLRGLGGGSAPKSAAAAEVGGGAVGKVEVCWGIC